MRDLDRELLILQEQLDHAAAIDRVGLALVHGIAAVIRADIASQLHAAGTDPEKLAALRRSLTAFPREVDDRLFDVTRTSQRLRTTW